MELFAVVLEKLKVTNQNTLTFSYLKYLKSDTIMKLGFSVDDEEKYLILVKIRNPYLNLINQDFYGNKNVSTPVFSINQIGFLYDVFEGEFLMDYCFQDYIDFDHMTLILKTCATLHSNFLLKSSANIQSKDNVKCFYRSLHKCIQKAHTITFDDNIIDLNHLNVQYYKLLELLKTTLNTDYLVPSIGDVHFNVVLFKYDLNGKPVDIKILVSNASIYVPPLYDVLVLILTCTSNDTIKDFLDEFLRIYYGQLIKHFGNKLYDSNQIDFQIRSFIPFIKLIRFAGDLSKISVSNNNTILQEISEYLHCPNLLREECYEILQNYLEHRKYFLQNFSLTPLPQRFGNLGDYFKLNMKIQQETGKSAVDLFVKFLPSNNETTNALAKTGPSKKEDCFYNFFLQEFRNCGLSNYLSFASKCFMSKINHVLVLEDLGLQGYKLNTDQNFSYNMLSLSIKKLAHLHACSIVYEEAKSREYSKTFRLDEYYGDYFKEILFQTEEENDMKIFADIGEKAVTEYLIYLYPEICKNLSMEEFHRKSKLAFKSFYSKIKKSNNYRNTLCHGDTWATNIMFKFDSNNFPIDCKWVDFQLIRYCPPIQDVMSHIYLTTRRDIRTEYLTILLEEYYEELSKIVKSFGFSMENILPADEFQRSCRYMKSQAVCQALFYSPINLTSAEDRVSVFGDPERFERIMKQDRSPFIEEMIKKHPFYKGRLGELIQDLYEICEKEQYL